MQMALLSKPPRTSCALDLPKNLNLTLNAKAQKWHCRFLQPEIYCTPFDIFNAQKE